MSRQIRIVRADTLYEIVPRAREGLPLLTYWYTLENDHVLQETARPDKAEPEAEGDYGQAQDLGSGEG